MSGLIKNRDNAAENAENNCFSDSCLAVILALKGVSELKKFIFGVFAAVFLLMTAVCKFKSCLTNIGQQKTRNLNIP